MTGVSLQTLSLRVVPQLKRIVKRRSKNIFAIWRELDKRNRRIVVVDERFQALSARRVPYTAEPVVARRDNERSIAIEVHS